MMLLESKTVLRKSWSLKTDLMPVRSVNKIGGKPRNFSQCN